MKSVLVLLSDGTDKILGLANIIISSVLVLVVSFLVNMNMNVVAEFDSRKEDDGWKRVAFK